VKSIYLLLPAIPASEHERCVLPARRLARTVQAC
jgi:hypothetical protein